MPHRPYGAPVQHVESDVASSARRSFVAWHVAPLAVALLYFALVKLAPGFSKAVLSTEQGLIEIGTAVFFAASAVVAFRIARDSGVPTIYRALFFLFMVAAVFVTLEETSYGQNFFRWETPEWFLRHNVNRETNLHNLFHNKPSRRFQAAAVLAFPIVCIAVPLFFRWRGGAYRRGEWRFYLLPGLELATLAIVAAAVNWPNNLPESVVKEPWRGPEL
ncbi:MAG: hypothetical protein ACREQJ_02810, partial [Candidatus Binatia bacterium]